MSNEPLLLPSGAPSPGTAAPPLRLGQLLRRRSRTIALSAALSTAAGVAYLWWAPSLYQAEATLLIEEPAAEIFATASFRPTPELAQVETELSLLKSRALAEAVVKEHRLQVQVVRPAGGSAHELFATQRLSEELEPLRLDFRRKEGGRFEVRQLGAKERLGLFAPGEPIALEGGTITLSPRALQHRRLMVDVLPVSLAAQVLLEKIEVERAGRESRIVAVRYQSSDPRESAEVVNSLLAHYIQLHREAQTRDAGTSAAFIRAQLDTLSRQLALSEERLRSFRNRQRVVNLAVEGSTGLSTLAGLQAQRAGLEAERAALAELARQTAGGAGMGARSMMAFPTLLRNPTASELLRSLAEMENRRSELLLRRSESDPDVQVLSRRIEELEGQLGSLVNTYLSGLSSQVQAIDREISTSAGRLDAIPSREIELAQLEREPQVLRELYALLRTRLQEAEIAEASQGTHARIVDTATRPRQPFHPKPSLYLALSLFSGIFLGVGLVLVGHYRDGAVHTRAEVERLSQTPVLGWLPRHESPSRLPAAWRRLGRGGGTPLLLPAAESRSASADAYDRLQANLVMQNPGMRTLLITSPQPGDGKTTTASNLALTLARDGLRVLLVDADLRRGTLAELLGLEAAPGLAEVLTGKRSLARAIQKVEGAGFHCLTTGCFPEHPGPLLRGERIRRLLEPLRKKYDVVILDSPPLSVAADGLFLASLADAALLVVRADATAAAALEFAAGELRRAGVREVVSVLNDIDPRQGDAYESFYSYYRDTGAWESAPVVVEAEEVVVEEMPQDPEARA